MVIRIINIYTVYKVVTINFCTLSKTSGERASGFLLKEISFSFTATSPSDPIFIIFLKNQFGFAEKKPKA